MDGGVTTYLLTQGVLGISVLVLGYVVGKLYSKTERLEKEKSDIAEARKDGSTALSVAARSLMVKRVG